jgi:hypothetical protein
LLYGAESGAPNCCCNPLISLFMAISSESVEEFRFPISFSFGPFSDEELALPISVFMEISLVGGSIFPPSDSVVALQAKVSRFQRVRAAKPLRAKLESLDLFLSGIALGSPNLAQKSLRGACAAVAIRPSLLKSIGKEGTIFKCAGSPGQLESINLPQEAEFPEPTDLKRYNSA